MLQQTIQVIACAVWVICASPIAGAISPQWWYGLGAALAGVQLVVSIFLLPETKYNRLLAAYQESSQTNTTEDLEASSAKGASGPIICTERLPLDFVNYAPRTWRSDMRLWIGSPEWKKAVDVYKVLNLFIRRTLVPKN